MSDECQQCHRDQPRLDYCIDCWDTLGFEIKDLRARLAEAEARVRELEGAILAYIHANTHAGVLQTPEAGEGAYQAFCKLITLVAPVNGERTEGAED